MDIIFGCQKNDNEFGKLVNAEFENIETLENFSFSGMEEFLIFLIPLTAVSVQIVDFIMTHIQTGKQKKENEREDKNIGRVVIVKGKKYTFEGYTKDEVIEILKELE